MRKSLKKPLKKARKSSSDQIECEHEWSAWERDGDFHDARHCVKCGEVESRDYN
jgi:hypothetical protein